MVNPGGFTGLRKQFLDSQKGIYAAAVKANHINDTVADIQRRYFKRFPVTLPHSQEPTEDELAAVDDNAPDAELMPPSRQDGTDTDEFSCARRVYDLQILEIKMRKAQIKRRLQYVYNKEQSAKTTFELGSTDPMAILMGKLTGISTQKPRQKTPYNLWGPQHRSLVDPIFLECVRSGNVPAKRQAALRSSIYKELFEALPEDEKNEWVEKVQQEHQDAMEKAGIPLKAGPSQTPEDRQRVIECLPRFVEPILDLIAEHTGWKVTMLAGGPEPADGGRLNIVSIHSGTTTGAVKMNFGRSERTMYLDVIVPTYAKFLKKCYSVQDCRDRALPPKSNFTGLAGAEQQEDVEIHTIDDGRDRPNEMYVKIADPRQTATAARVASNSKSKTPDAIVQPSSGMKIGPPKGKKKQPSPKISNEKVDALKEVAKATSTEMPTSRAPTPMISRPPSPTHINQNVAAPIKKARAVSMPQLVSEHTKTCVNPPRAASAAPTLGSSAAYLPESNITPSTSSHAPSVEATVSAPDTATSPLHSANSDVQPEDPSSDVNQLALNPGTPPSCAPNKPDVPSNTNPSPLLPAPNAGILNVSTQITPDMPSLNANPHAEIPPSTPMNAGILPSPTSNAKIPPPTQSAGSVSVPNLAAMAALQNGKKTRKRRGTATAETGPSIKRTRASAPNLALSAGMSEIGQKGKTARKARSISDLLMPNPNGSIIEAPKDCPAWVRNAIDLLQSAHLGDEWAALVINWLKFEEHFKYQGARRIAAQNRPDAIGQWIQRARKSTYRPEITNIGRYASEFDGWWRSIQPEWRIDGGSATLQRGDGDWEALRCPGINGLLSVMAGLFFWGVEVGGSSGTDKEVWMATLVDISYAVSQL